MTIFSQIAIVAVAIVASLWDIKTRRIPNALTMGAAAAALVFHTVAAGWQGALLSVSGLIVGLAIFFPLFMLKGMGAGDVKLLGALGAWLGPGKVIWTAVYGGIAGGVLAIVVAVFAGYLRRALSNLWGLFLFWRAAGIRPMPALTLAAAPGPRLAYAIPISAGAVITLWLRS